MKFRVEIETEDDAAIDEGAYQVIINALRDIVDSMECGGSGPFAYRIRDVNGNTIGRTSFDEC